MFTEMILGTLLNRNKEVTLDLHQGLIVVYPYMRKRKCR